MDDIEQQSDDQEEQYSINDDNISSLIKQIFEQLIRMRQDDLELTEQLTTLYDSLCNLRQSLTNPLMNSNLNVLTVPTEMDSLTASRYQSKPRSDSEPNILSDRKRIITIMEDFQ